MKRSYSIEWYNKSENKYRKEPIIRTHTLVLSKPIGKTAVDAKTALNIFIKTFGNLNKNEVVRIKEFGENGQIGEDIVPSATGDSIIPIGR